MAADNPRIPLINLNATGGNLKYTELRHQSPSVAKTDAHKPSATPPATTINIPTKIIVHNEKVISTPSTSVNDYDLRRLPTQQRRFVKKAMMANVGYRLAKRKDLHIKRRLICDIMCAIGLLGIFLMIIESELTFNRLDHKDTTVSLLIKATITFTSIILFGLVFYYHRLDVNLYCVDNSIDDWRIALTRSRLLLIILEALVCAIHPIPGHFLVEWSSQYVRGYTNPNLNPYQSSLLSPIVSNFSLTTIVNENSNNDNSATSSVSYVPIDVMLSLPMFLRLYLLCRLIMLRSHLVRDASSQSLGYLNRVSFNFRFVIKAYITKSPAFSLMSFCITSFFIASWSLRACDYNIKTGHMRMLDAMWLFIVSFATIGYGDIVPSTYCGRGIAAISGLIGVFSTALLVAVISQKLELTRSEKYVHNFVTDIDLAKRHRHEAANVVKYGWKVWFLKRKGKHMFIDYIKAQRKLLTSIHRIRKIKHEQRKLGDNCITLLEVYNSQKLSNVTTDDVSQKVISMERKVDRIEDKLITMNINLQSMQDTMNIIIDKLN